MPDSSSVEGVTVTATGEAAEAEVEATGTSTSTSKDTTLQPKDLAELLAADQSAAADPSESKASSVSCAGPAVSVAVTVGPGTRRSARARTQQLQDPVIAPGFGTAKDLQRLARELSTSTDTTTATGTSLLPVEAVQCMMESRGRGIRSSTRTTAADSADDATNPAAATPVSSAWADFMTEAGVGAGGETTATAPDTKASKRSREDAGTAGTATASNSAAAAHSNSASESRVYNKKTKSDDDVDDTKKAADDKGGDGGGGVLVQTGTLDSAAVGRSKKLDLDAAHCLMVPTRILLGSVKIANVFAAGHACHSIAISVTGVCYGWGRNESQQLGSQLPTNVYEPTVISIDTATATGTANTAVKSAAVGKSHTLLLLESGQVCAAGFNKLGQCGIKSSTETVPNFRKCVFAGMVDSDDIMDSIVQVRSFPASIYHVLCALS